MAEESGWLVGSRQILVNFYYTELNTAIYKNSPKAHPQMVWWRHHDSWLSKRQIIVVFYIILFNFWLKRKNTTDRKYVNFLFRVSINENCWKWSFSNNIVWWFWIQRDEIEVKITMRSWLKIWIWVNIYFHCLRYLENFSLSLFWF